MSSQQTQSNQTVEPSVQFRNWIKKNSQFPPAKGRYHLYVSYTCPFAHRALIVRSLKGLQSIIGLSIVHPCMQQTRENEEHYGWAFSTEALKNKNGNASYKVSGATLDPINNAKFIRDIYEKCKDVTGKYSVPVLFDTVTQQIVNNESAEIIQIFNKEFNEYAENPSLDLEPEELIPLINEINQSIAEKVNLGVYKCGFTLSQEQYALAYNELFNELDKLEEILSRQRYLVGNTLTLSDIRLFTSLIRFDEIYYILFKTNKKKISQYPSLLNFCRDLYQMKGVQETCNYEHIKIGYYGGMHKLNPNGLVPLGDEFEQLLKQPHNRDSLTKL